MNASIYSRLLLTLLLLLFFFTFNQGVVKVSFLRYADEVVLVFSLCVIMLAVLKGVLAGVINRVFLFLGIYVICQYVNYLMSPFDLSLFLVLMQSFINIKLFVVSLAFVILIRSTRLADSFYGFYYGFVFLFLLGFFLNMLFGETWNDLLDYKVEYRYGFLRPAGWFSDIGQNAYFFVLFFSTLFLLYFKKQCSEVKGLVTKFFVFVAIDFFLAYILTVRKGLLFVVPLYYLAFKGLRLEYKVLFTLLSVIFSAVFLSAISSTQMYLDSLDNIGNFFHDQHGYVRGLVFYYGITLFADFFPFGVGAGTYGTVLSQYNTLEVYEYVGMPEYIYILDGVFREETAIYDSGIASFIAENGFLGLLSLVFFVYYFFRFNKRHLDRYNYTIFSLLTWFTMLLSITDPVFQSGLYTVFYVMNLLMLYAKSNMVKMNGEWVRVISCRI